MKNPCWLNLVVICLVALGIGAAVVSIVCGPQALQVITNLAVVLTLAVLIIYAYHTYLLAKDAWTPSAAFVLEPYPSHPYHFLFLLQNHSKVSLQCWCNLNATVYGQPVALDGFYGGKTSFDLQPFGVATGHFDLSDILCKANRTVEEMKHKASPSDTKQQLRLEIEFWYNAFGSTSAVRNVKQPHYFDFVRDAMVADF
jgi:hypothetical protein